MVKYYRLFLAACMTFIWLTPYDIAIKYFWPIQILVLAVSLYYVLKYLITKKMMLKNSIYIWIFLYGCSTMLPSFFRLELSDVFVNFVTMINIMAMFAFFELKTDRYSIYTYIGCLSVLIFYLFKDLILLRQKGVGDMWHIYTYYTGGKFDVGYNMMLILLLVYLIIKDTVKLKKIIFYAVSCLLILWNFKFSCMTVVLGIIIIDLVLILFDKTKLKKLLSYKMVIIIFLGAAVVVFFMNSIMSLKIVTSFTQKVMHRTLTLTGRLKIYPKVINVLKASPLIGFGRSTNFATKMIGYSNLQNGLLQILYLYGAVGAISFYVLIRNFLKQIFINKEKCIIFIAVFLGYTICSISEIVYGYTEFFYFMAIGYSYLNIYRE